MKKVFILFSALTLGFFTSCSDDDSEDSPENSLMGSWQLTAEFENGETYELDNCDLEETIIFKSDGIYDLIDYNPVEGNENECAIDEDGLESGEWSLPSSGKILIVTDSDENVLDYSISGNELTITAVDEYEGETDVNKYVYVRK